MRLTCLLLVGIAASACRDKQPAKAETTPGAARATPGSAAPATQPRSQLASSPPTLEVDRAFDAEARDAAWAGATEQAIHAVAPQLTDVTCKQMLCRVTLTASSEAELVEAVDELQSDRSVEGLDGAKHIILTRPESRDGRHAMNVYVRFDRD